MELQYYFYLFIIGTLLYFCIIIFAIIRMDPDYFIRDKSVKPTRTNHPYLWWVVKLIKNIIGIGLVIVGFLMLVLPGQGVLTIFMGLLFMDFPGKRKLEISLTHRPGIQKIIDEIRLKANRPPIKWT
ncbi:MAG: PGPGW domain-containing protein [Chlamydiota bacterium]